MPPTPRRNCPLPPPTGLKMHASNLCSYLAAGSCDMEHDTCELPHDVLGAKREPAQVQQGTLAVVFAVAAGAKGDGWLRDLRRG